MKIKELENELSISRSQIRFYEKQGLFSPERKDNNYRKYTEQDIELLKKIIIFRKMGFSVEEIKLLQSNELPFEEAITNVQHRIAAIVATVLIVLIILFFCSIFLLILYGIIAAVIA